jgi:hypothetical protein
LVVGDVFGDAFLSIESLECYDDVVLFVKFVNEFYDLGLFGDVFHPGERDLVRIYLIEPFYQFFIEVDIRIEGEYGFVGMVIDIDQSGCFDVGVYEEIFIGVFFYKLIQLFEFFRGAVEVIIHCYPYDTIYFRHKMPPLGYFCVMSIDEFWWISTPIGETSKSCSSRTVPRLLLRVFFASEMSSPDCITCTVSR